MEFLELLNNVSILSVILFIAGIVFIVIELYQPGFGVFGVMGVILLVICILVTAQTIMQGVLLTAIIFIIVVILLILFLAVFSGNRLPKKMVLKESTSAELGFSGTQDMGYLLGKSGTVISICRPAGYADIDGARYDVVSRGEFIEKGKTIEVIEVEGSRIVVRAG